MFMEYKFIVVKNLKNGNQYGYVNDVPFLKNEYDFLRMERTEADYIKIKSWVKSKIMPHMTRKTFNFKHTSYGIKHWAENENQLGFYVSNGDIKLILQELGVPYKSNKYQGINLFYPLSEKAYKKIHFQENILNS